MDLKDACRNEINDVTTEPFEYSSRTTPKGYACNKCGATGCKLWRDYNTFLVHQNLLCVTCTGKAQKKDVSRINEEGQTPCKVLETDDYEMWSDSIGWMVPAVPTEDGETYWGYTSVPEEGCIWWRGLPSRPVL